MKLGQPPQLAFDTKNQAIPSSISSSSSIEQTSKLHYENYFKIKLLAQYISQLSEPERLSKEEQAEFITRTALTDLALEYACTIF